VESDAAQNPSWTTGFLASWPSDLTAFRKTLAELDYRVVGAYFKKSRDTKISFAAQVRY
jgi:hypothetical protein